MLLHVPVAGTATTSTTNCLDTENEEERAHEKETQMAVNSSRGKKKKEKMLMKGIKGNQEVLTGHQRKQGILKNEVGKHSLHASTLIYYNIKN